MTQKAAYTKGLGADFIISGAKVRILQSQMLLKGKAIEK